MNISKIKEVVNGFGEDSSKEEDILKILSDDPNVIIILLQILGYERKESGRLITESNAELSRALVTLVEPDIKKTTGTFVIGQIKAHYHKWQHRIRCCFKFDDLPN